MSFDVATRIVKCDHCDTGYLVAPGRFTGFPVNGTIECGVCGNVLFQSTDLDPWYPLCQVGTLSANGSRAASSSDGHYDDTSAFT